MDINDKKNNISRRQFVAGSGMGTAAAVLATLPASAMAAPGSAIQQPQYQPDDSFFGPAYIDIDETRQSPVPHRYIHGGFRNTDTRFSFYFPPANKYQGRFFHLIEGGMGGNENSAAASTPQGVAPVASLSPVFEMGGYLVESNQGHIGADLNGAKGDPTIINFRASAESAKFGKFMAKRVYDREPRYGYIFGGSGGGVRSIRCLENTKGIWDGGVPFVIPHQSQGVFFSIQANAIRLIGQEKLAKIADAVTVGGSGKPFEGLNAEQARALALLYKTGFPRGVTLKDAFEAVLVWSWTAYLFDKYDPTYFTDFYTKPGYIGHDNPASLAPWRVSHPTRVRRTLTAQELADYTSDVKSVDQMGIGEQSRIFMSPRRSPPARNVALLIEGGNLDMMGCARVEFKTGAGVGRNLYVLGVTGDALVVSGVGNEFLDGVKAGDEVLIDNSRYLAFCHHYMHQVEPRFEEWGQSVVDGQPIYPQRARLERLFSGDYNFDLTGKKVIIVNGLQDRGTWPSSPVHYRANLARTMGIAADDVSRLWFNQQQQHIDGAWMVPVGAPVPTTEFIDYGGIVHEGLRQVVAWVEDGKAPLPSSRFQYTRDSQVIIAEDAKERGGVQAKVTVTGNGKANRLQIVAGQAVDFKAVAEAIPGAGSIVSLEWDFDGLGKWPVKMDAIPDGARQVTHMASHTYDRPGTYFPSCRIVSQYAGSKSSPNFRIMNLGRMRVVVG